MSLQALPHLPQVRGVWSEGAFARLGDVVDYYFRWLPAAGREPLAQLYEGLGWLDCGIWASCINPVDCLSPGNVPIYFCHAGNDELIPLEDGLALFESYTGPKASWWVEGATHYDVRQRNHEEYLRRLRAFLEQCLSTSQERTLGREQHCPLIPDNSGAARSAAAPSFPPS